MTFNEMKLKEHVADYFTNTFRNKWVAMNKKKANKLVTPSHCLKQLNQTISGEIAGNFIVSSGAKIISAHWQTRCCTKGPEGARSKVAVCLAVRS